MPKDLYRAWRAEVRFLEHRLEHPARTGSPTDVELARQATGLDAVLLIDPDHFEARNEKAVVRYYQRDFAAALAILEPYLEDDYPRLRNRAGLRFLQASILTDWYVEEDVEEAYHAAGRAYSRLFETHSRFTQAYAHMLTLTLTRADRAKDANLVEAVKATEAARFCIRKIEDLEDRTTDTVARAKRRLDTIAREIEREIEREIAEG